MLKPLTSYFSRRRNDTLAAVSFIALPYRRSTREMHSRVLYLNNQQQLEDSSGAGTFVAGRSLISSLRLPMDVLQRMTASSLLFTFGDKKV